MTFFFLKFGIYLFFWSCQIHAELSNSFVTVTTQERPIPQKNILEIEPESPKTIHPENILLNSPSVSVMREGGQLTNTRVKIRGLSDARLSLKVDGLTIDDPTSSLSDLNDLPFFAATAAEVNENSDDIAGQVSLQLPSINQSFIQGAASFGSFSSSELWVLGQKKWGNSATLIGFRQAKTQGDFSFAATSASGAELDHILVRQNNDQQRSQFIWRSTLPLLGSRFQWFALANFHEGGIAGFAHAPLSLRQRKSSAGAHLKIVRPFSPHLFTFEAHSRIHNTDVWDLKSSRDVNSLTSLEHKAGLALKNPLNKSTDLKTGLSSSLAHLLQHDFYRLSTEADGLAIYHFNNALPGTFEGQLIGKIFSDVGILVNARLGSTVKPLPQLSLGLHVSKNSRPPSLLELYSPQTLILGNDQLKPENSYDLSTFAQLQQPSWHAKIGLFGGFLQQGIFYVNQNAFEIKPVNTAGGVRTGAEFNAQWQPWSFVGLSGNAHFIYTRLLATSAPFPTTPLFSFVSSVQLGKEKEIQSTLTLRYQGKSSSNLFGTLNTVPFALLDWLLKIPVHEAVALNLSVSNVFNVLYARDSHQFPLPGREIMISIYTNYME